MSAVMQTEVEKLTELNYLGALAFSDLLSVLTYDPELRCFLTEDGRLSRIYQLPNIPDEGLLPEDKQHISNVLALALDRYPEGASGQYIRHDHTDIAVPLARFYNAIEGDGFHREIARSMVQRQLAGSKAGFFATIDDQAIQKAKADLAAQFKTAEERDQVLIDLDVNIHSGSLPMMTEQYLVFTYTPTYHRGFRFSEFTESMRDLLSNRGGVSEAIFDRELSRFDNYANNVYKALARAGVNPLILTGQGLVDMLYRMCNPTRNRNSSRTPQYNPNQTIREIVLGLGPANGGKKLSRYATYTDIYTSNAGLKIGDYHYRVTSAKTAPLSTSAGELCEVLNSYEGQGWVSINFSVRNQAQFRLQLKSRQGGLEIKEAMGKKVAFLRGDPNHMNQIREHLQIALSETNPERKDRMLAFNASFHCVSYGKDIEEVERRAEAFEEQIWRSGYFEKMRGDAIIHYSLPLNNRSSAEKFVSRSFSMLSINLMDLLPIYTGFQGVHDANCLLNNANGSPCFVDPFTRETTAPHGLVVGGTGTGKSFLFNFILMMLYAIYRPKIILVDKGGSYRSLTDVLGGEYIYLSTESGGEKGTTCINPLYISSDESGERRMPTNNELQYIRGIVVAMIQNDTKGKDGQGEQVSKIEKNLLLEVLKELFEKNYKERELVLSDLLIALQNLDGDDERQKMGRNLAARFRDFTQEGLYGALFDGPLQMNWENDLIVFETEEMATSPALEVVMLVLFYQIETYVKRKLPGDRKKIVGVDEAWAVLADPFLASQFSGYYRELRKYACAVFLISQSLEDFVSLVNAEGSTPEGILKNTRHYYLLGTTKTDYKFASDVLGFTEEDVRTWQSIRSLPPFFSEMFYYMIRKDNSGSGGKTRLYSSPVGLWTASTDPADKAMRDPLAKRYAEQEGYSPSEAKQRAVLDLSKQYPYGSRYDFKHITQLEQKSDTGDDL